MTSRNPAAAATPRFDTIDVLRGLSILAVVLLHTWLRFFMAGYDLRPFLPPMAAHLIFFNGGNGVTVFFAVSGFLITLTSVRRFGSLSAMKPAIFYRIRFARIAPLLLLLITVLSCLALALAQGFQFTGKRAPLWRAILAALTFHLNCRPHVDNVDDSLAYYIALRKAGVPVEMHLYAQGGHAFGLRRTKLPITGWPQLVRTWLCTIGVVER